MLSYAFKYHKMDIINRIVRGMNKEDIRFFKIYATKTHAGEDRKDIQLFDYIKKSGEAYDDDKIAQQLYGEGSKNAFYRLKNRLTDTLNKCLYIQHFEEDENNHILFMVSLSHYYFNQNAFKVALNHLKKAEKKALKQENYELLDIIYTEFIRLSQELVTINPEVYINKRKENQAKLNHIRQIDDVLATVKYKLKITQNFSPGKNPVMDMLEQTVGEFSQSEELKESAVLRFKIYQAVSQILLQKHDFQNLEGYLLTTYKQFSEEKLFNRNNHNTKLQMLTYLVNTLFKNGKIEESLSYADHLKQAMEEHNRYLYDKYWFFYYNSLVINYSKIDLDKAIEILEELKTNDLLRKTPFYEVFVYLNLGIFYFDKKDYRKAIRYINQLYLLDSYKNADTSLQFKIAIAELIIRHELQDFDFLEYRVGQVERDYKSQIGLEENNRERDLLRIIEIMAREGFSKGNKKLIDLINQFLQHKLELAEDTEMINYNKWLNTKIKA